MAWHRSGTRRAAAVVAVVSMAVAALAMAYSLGPAAGQRQSQLFTGRTMGTYYRLTIVGQNDLTDAEAFHGELQAAAERVEALMSTYRPESELSRFNASRQTDWVPVARETAAVVHEAIDVGRKSGGGYDVTVGPLVNLWTFGPDHHRPIRCPSEAEIAKAKARVGLDRLEVRLDPPSLRKQRPDVYVDLSSIAKGYAVDQVAETLDRRGLADYCVDIGGEVRAKGLNARGFPWQIGIERPLPNEQSIEQVVPLSNLAMATSGDYRNYFEEDGVRYCHEIDPRTGRPICHTLASVTVIDPSCAQADAWATALLVAGPYAGYELAVKNRLAAFFIVKTPSGLVEKWTPEFAPLLGESTARELR
ncbi:MAG: FAD:protein FMN transferase [Thermoguttaceae bacterium]